MDVTYNEQNWLKNIDDINEQKLTEILGKSVNYKLVLQRFQNSKDTTIDDDIAYLCSTLFHVVSGTSAKEFRNIIIGKIGEEAFVYLNRILTLLLDTSSEHNDDNSSNCSSMTRMSDVESIRNSPVHNPGEAGFNQQNMENMEIGGFDHNLSSFENVNDQTIDLDNTEISNVKLIPNTQQLTLNDDVEIESFWKPNIMGNGVYKLRTAQYKGGKQITIPAGGTTLFTALYRLADSNQKKLANNQELVRIAPGDEGYYPWSFTIRERLCRNNLRSGTMKLGTKICPKMLRQIRTLNSTHCYFVTSGCLTLTFEDDPDVHDVHAITQIVIEPGETYTLSNRANEHCDFNYTMFFH